MSTVGRVIGLVLALAMCVCSIFFYRQTGDWVAVVFLLGSLGYLAFFLGATRRR